MGTLKCYKKQTPRFKETYYVILIAIFLHRPWFAARPADPLAMLHVEATCDPAMDLNARLARLNSNE